MADEPTDDDARERSRRASESMNALLRGDDQSEADDEPADFNAAIRRAAGRPFNTKTNEEK